MRPSEKMWVVAMTLAASAAVQSCSDGVAERIDPASEPDLRVSAARACPAGTTPAALPAEGGHCQLTGVIDMDVHLPAGRFYQLAGMVQIGLPLDADATPEQIAASRRTLSIEPGAVIYGLDRDSGLVIARGSGLEAIGAADQPIIFTSAHDLGLDTALGIAPRVNAAAPRGEWAGIVINGMAPLAASPEAAFNGPYGGAGQAAPAVALRHAQIRFAGAQTVDGAVRRSPALALRAVDAGSALRDITISGAFGDGVQVVGGSVGIASVAVLGAGDDGLEWSEGYDGEISAMVVSHQAALGDADNGFEGSGPGAGPLLRDVTVFGDIAVSDSALLLRSGAQARIEGARFTGGFADGAIDLDGALSYEALRPNAFRNVRIDAGVDRPAFAQDFDDRTLAARLSGEAVEIAAFDLTLETALAEASRSFEASASMMAALSAPPALPVATGVAGPAEAEAQAAQADPAKLSRFARFNPAAANAELVEVAALNIQALPDAPSAETLDLLILPTDYT